MSQSFVNTLVDPIIFSRENEEEILYCISQDNYTGKIPYNETNLNMVVYRNGIEVPAGSSNADVSYVFSASKRTLVSAAPEINSEGEPDLIVSLYTPSGEIYATKRATEDLSISVAVPASDNQAGNWKYVVENVQGIDGNSAVLVASVSGLYNVGEPHPRPQKKNLTGNGSYLRGAQKNIFYHQLGDRNTTIQSDSSINTLSFGPLVKRNDVQFYRIEGDLVLEIAGTADSVTLNGWFADTRKVDSVVFANGSKLTANEIQKLATDKEPDLIYELISPDHYVVGTDGNERLSYDGDRDVLFVGLRGDDTLVGSKRANNIFYYRKGDGNKTLIINKGEKKLNILRFHNDIKTADVSVSRTGSDIVFAVGDSGKISVPEGTTKLDRVEFFGGIVWDTRDINKLLNGKSLVARRMTVVIPNSASMGEISTGENGGALDSVEKKSSGSACNTVGIQQLLMLGMLPLGVLSMKRIRN